MMIEKLNGTLLSRTKNTPKPMLKINNTDDDDIFLQYHADAYYGGDGTKIPAIMILGQDFQQEEQQQKQAPTSYKQQENSFLL